MLKKLRRKFVAGLVTIAPIIATIFIIKVLFGFFDGLATPFLDKILPFHIPGLGFIITILSIIFLGFLATNILGKTLVNWGEWILNKIPVAKTVYSTAKQITNALTGSSSRAFQKAILFQYPRKGIWTLAFVTGSSVDSEQNKYYHLFVPTTPNPTSGFMLIVPVNETQNSNLTIEEALRIIISGGILAPGKNEISILPGKN